MPYIDLYETYRPYFKMPTVSSCLEAELHVAYRPIFPPPYTTPLNYFLANLARFLENKDLLAMNELRMTYMQATPEAMRLV